MGAASAHPTPAPTPAPAPAPPLTLTQVWVDLFYLSVVYSLLMLPFFVLSVPIISTMVRIRARLRVRVQVRVQVRAQVDVRARITARARVGVRVRPAPSSARWYAADSLDPSTSGSLLQLSSTFSLCSPTLTLPGLFTFDSPLPSSSAHPEVLGSRSATADHQRHSNGFRQVGHARCRPHACTGVHIRLHVRMHIRMHMPELGMLGAVLTLVQIGRMREIQQTMRGEAIGKPSGF